MDTKLLEEIGLTRSEALVYLALSEIGPSSTGKIIQKAKVSSSKIYEILDKLERKGLVSYIIKTGVKEFEAAPPERILLYVEEKEKEFLSEKIKAEKLVSLLESKISLVKSAQEATIYRGLKGLKTAFYHCTKSMKAGSTIMVIGVPSRSPKVDRFFVRWNKFRAKNRIKMRIMFNESARGQLQTLPENSPLSEIRFMPEEVVTPAAVNIFDDKIIIFPYESGDDPLLIMIRSKEITDSFRAQFELLWKQNVKTFYGLEGPKFVLKDMMREGKDICAFGLEHAKLEANIPQELKEFVEATDREKMKERLIFTGKGQVLRHQRVAFVRYLPERFSTPFHYEIYGNKVAVLYWIRPIITTIIEDENVAKNFRKHFEEMWRMAEEKLGFDV